MKVEKETKYKLELTEQDKKQFIVTVDLLFESMARGEMLINIDTLLAMKKALTIS